MLKACLQIKTIGDSINLNHEFPRMQSISCVFGVFQAAFGYIKNILIAISHTDMMTLASLKQLRQSIVMKAHGDKV